MKLTDQQNYLNELKLAAEFQQAVLPDIVDVDYLDIAIHFDPFNTVSGDVYDFKLNREKELAIFVGDATGHGISSALMTMMVHIAIDGLTPNLSTDESIRKLNQMIASRQTGRFVTGVFFRISPTGLLSVTHAGHPSILIVDSATNNITQFAEAGCPLGMFEEEPLSYQHETYQLRHGDKIIAYTDGLTEWKDDNNQAYSLDRLTDCISRHANTNCQGLIDRILDDVIHFSQGTEKIDDMTLLTAMFNVR